MFKKKVRYQLLRAKVEGDYKNPNAIPKLTVIKDSKGVEKKVQDMEIICKDYNLKIPLILYNQNEAHDVVAGKPLIVFDNDLYAVYNFTQVGEYKGKIVVNIFVLYAGDSNISPICKVE